MLKRIAEWRISGLVVVISLLMLSGCDRQEPAAKKTAEKTAEQAQPAETAKPAAPAEKAVEQVKSETVKPAEKAVEQVKSETDKPAEKAVEQTKSAEAAEQDEPEKEPAKDIAAQIDALIKVKLAAADRLDGKTDKIVTKCASCALSMDGKKEHSLKVDEYTLYFCTEKCKSGFAKNTTESIKSLEIPDMKVPKLP